MVIGRDGTIEGLVSRSDLKAGVSPYLRPAFAKWRRPSDDATLQIRVKWVMSRPVRTISPETSVVSLIEGMLEFSGRCLPVVDQENKVRGLVTVFDIFRVLLSSDESISAAAEISEETVGSDFAKESANADEMPSASLPEPEGPKPPIDISDYSPSKRVPASRKNREIDVQTTTESLH